MRGYCWSYKRRTHPPQKLHPRRPVPTQLHITTGLGRIDHSLGWSTGRHRKILGSEDRATWYREAARRENKRERFKVGTRDNGQGTSNQRCSLQLTATPIFISTAHFIFIFEHRAVSVERLHPPFFLTPIFSFLSCCSILSDNPYYSAKRLYVPRPKLMLFKPSRIAQVALSLLAAVPLSTALSLQKRATICNGHAEVCATSPGPNVQMLMLANIAL